MPGRVLLNAILIALLSVTIVAQAVQAPPTQAESQPSAVGAHAFVSPEGRFSVALPQQNHAYTELVVPTPFGDAKGSFYQWTMKEGTFGAGYAEAAQPLDSPEVAQQVFDKLREELKKLATTANGTVTEPKPIKLDNYSGIEQRLTTFTGTLIQRTYLVSRRAYQVIAVTKNTQQMYEGVNARVLDSFKILSDVEAAAAMAREVARAEPSPLPQAPVAPREGSDAGDESLQGRVKSVLTERQNLSGGAANQTRQPSSFATYSERGNKVRAELYDSKGNLTTITVYGYIDGNRVSNSESIQHEYDPPISGIGPGPGIRKFDSRYEIRLTFKYDDKKRLTESTLFRSNGDPMLRYVYNYQGKQKEELVYFSDGRLSRRNTSTLDDKGNKVEETVFERSGAVRLKQSFVYEFDAKGNWTKRTASKVVTIDGREEVQPQTVYYRTITYY